MWRSKLFEQAAFYGDTALRILHGMDRFSEDLDFSLLYSMGDFDLEKYGKALEKEVRTFGFEVSVEKRNKAVESPVQSTFLRANTINELLVIQAAEVIVREVPRNQILKIKLEVDTDPPPGFSTESRYLLQPIPFAVRTYALPDLFAGKMHAVICRRWRGRVKGRDWYDFVWLVAHHPELHLAHFEERMRQSGHWTCKVPLDEKTFQDLLLKTIDGLNVDQARREVEPFVSNPEALKVWSRDFFHDVASRIRVI
ncbi:MAG: nucleotidyl transferase AbiEii/AbiGii toxin family protein [Candidatus Glassbacteria bacterium]